MIAILRKQKVYELFKEYFGEDKVDMQDNCILVWWPELRVSNEDEEYCYIKNLYARVRVDNAGTLSGTFSLNRTDYSYDQWISKYCHSHVQRISRNRESIKTWREPCLGSGPIRETSSTLQVEYDEDVWRLFIYELDQYVRHESLEGVPYIKLRTIGTDPEATNSLPEIWKIPLTYTISPTVTRNDSNHNDILNILVRDLTKKIIDCTPIQI